MLNLQEQKTILRKEMRERIKNLSEEERVKQSQIICQRILNSAQWKQAKCLLLYFPLKDEPDISSLFATGCSEGKLLYLPQYDSTINEYSIAPVRDLEKDTLIGKYGIREPITCTTRQKDIDIILVPGLCFDTTGARLGRGKGFYDRLLSQISGYKCGVCWEEGWLLKRLIPMEHHDARVDTCWCDL
jgi:5-formyltetrahydrofolate cyclo-ligase